MLRAYLYLNRKLPGELLAVKHVVIYNRDARHSVRVCEAALLAALRLETSRLGGKGRLDKPE